MLCLQYCPSTPNCCSEYSICQCTYRALSSCLPNIGSDTLHATSQYQAAAVKHGQLPDCCQIFTRSLKSPQAVDSLRDIPSPQDLHMLQQHSRPSNINFSYHLHTERRTNTTNTSHAAGADHAAEAAWLLEWQSAVPVPHRPLTQLSTLLMLQTLSQ